MTRRETQARQATPRNQCQEQKALFSEVQQPRFVPSDLSASLTMDEEGEDDIYAPYEGTALRSDVQSGSSNRAVKNEGEQNNEDEEEGEEVEEEESDSVGATVNLLSDSSLISLR